MWHILVFSVLFKANLCYPIFFQLKKKKALERKTKHNSNFSELGPKYFLGFLLPSYCSLADQAPWTPFPSDLPGGMYTLLKPLVLSTTACLKTPSLQVCCLGLPVLRTISRPASAPHAGENSSAFPLLLLFLTITAETLRPVRVAAMSYLQCFLYCLPHQRTHLSKCWVMD